MEEVIIIIIIIIIIVVIIIIIIIVIIIIIRICWFGSPDSVVSLVTKLRKGQIVVRFPPMALEFVILQSVKAGCGPHTFAHSVVTVVSFHKGKSTEACS